MRLDIVSLFPAICAGVLQESITGRALQKGLIKLNLVDLRDFTHDARRSVDDSPYGGGSGMLLRPEPLFECLQSLITKDSHVVLMTPQGEVFKQATAQRFSLLPHLILVCGHYEGIDERVRQCLMDEEISLGDYILTNGALAATVVADAVIRLLPDALGSDDSAYVESFAENELLEFPQYTRPAEFQNMKVPEVLLSGNHEKIAEWRQEQSLIRTVARRPDLLENNLNNKIQIVNNGEKNENKNEHY